MNLAYSTDNGISMGWLSAPLGPLSRECFNGFSWEYENVEYAERIHKSAIRWLDIDPKIDDLARCTIFETLSAGYSIDEAQTRAIIAVVSKLHENQSRQLDKLRLKGFFSDVMETAVLSINYRDLAERSVRRVMASTRREHDVLSDGRLA